MLSLWEVVSRTEAKGNRLELLVAIEEALEMLQEYDLLVDA
jgi:hypothetical protein